MPKMEFIGQSARDASFPTGNTSRLINGYREPMAPGGRSQAVLRAVPGMQNFAAIPNVFVREMTAFGGNIVAVVGDKLYTVTPAGGVTLNGTVSAPDDIVSMDQSTGKVLIGANLDYFTWDGTTLVSPATGAVTSVGSVAALGGYAIVTQSNGRTFAWSALADPATFPGLSFASAEITAEAIVRGVVFKDALYLFKRSGYERWGVTGLAGAKAFQRIEGAQGEPGLAAFNLITTFPNGMAWVGSDGRVQVLGMGPISTPPLEVAIATQAPKRMFFYEQRGHGFICLTFSDAFAWCYDVATGEWHERSQNNGPWEAAASVKLVDDWYMGTDAGKVAILGASCLDFGMAMPRQFVSNTLELDERFALPKLEAYPRPAGDQQGDGTPAKVTLRMSRDGAMTWGKPRDKAVGAAGAWQQRLVWRALGQFRKATAMLEQTGPVDMPMLSVLDVEVG